MKQRIYQLSILLVAIICILALASCNMGETEATESKTAEETSNSITNTENEGKESALSDCEHEWKKATCTQPKTCKLCDATSGKALGHEWLAATCTDPKTCERCEETQGEKLEHDYDEKILTEPSCNVSGSKKYTCSECGDSYTEKYELEKYSSNDVYELAKQSTGEIVTYDYSGAEYAIGTCFVLNPSGRIVTNWHVIEGAYSATVTMNETSYSVKSVLAYDKDIDLAVLLVDADDLPVLEICDKNHGVGNAVYALGSSRGLTATFSQGIITQEGRVIDDVTYVQHDAAISNGNSGGPLINEYGEIVGINTWTVKDSQNLNFAISVSELDNLNYGTPMTLKEVQDKETNVFLKLKNYVTANGEYDSTDNEYYLLLGVQTTSTATYRRSVYYDVTDDEIQFVLYTSDGHLLMLWVENEKTNTYSWGYTSDYGTMLGSVYAPTFTSSTILTYSQSSISSYLTTSVRELASTMLSYTCTFMYQDLEDIGIGAYDLGFINY